MAMENKASRICVSQGFFISSTLTLGKDDNNGTSRRKSSTHFNSNRLILIPLIRTTMNELKTQRKIQGTIINKINSIQTRFFRVEFKTRHYNSQPNRHEPSFTYFFTEIRIFGCA